MERPRHKTWIRTRPIVVFSILVLAFLALSLLAFWSPFFLVFFVPAAFFAYILLIVATRRWWFSPSGGDHQDRVHQLLVSRVHGDRVPDVGCGSGHLLAEIARARPSAAPVGLDFWGGNWEYSRELCIANLRAEVSEDRVTFVCGSASSLPRDLGQSDTVVSCLTFHEVNDVEDSTVSIREALALVTPGGRFAFVDLFGDSKFCPNAPAIDQAVTESGGLVTERVALGELLRLPFPLKHKRVLGHAQLMAGEKHGDVAWGVRPGPYSTAAASVSMSATIGA